MKIIHMADVHLDSPLTSHFDARCAAKIRAGILNLFKKTVAYAVSESVNTIIIAGDLFDGTGVSQATKTEVKNIILKNSSIIFFYVPGNHDEDISTFFDEIPDNLKIFGNKWTYYRLNTRVIVAGTTLKNNDMYTSLKLKSEDINIVTLHGQIVKAGIGGTAANRLDIAIDNNAEDNAYKNPDINTKLSADKSADKSANKNTENNIDNNSDNIYLNSLKNSNIDYLALGHVHSFSINELDSRGRYCYCGCLCGRGFDESGKHGFVLLDIDEEKGRIVESFVELPGQNIYDLKADISTCVDNYEIAEAIRKCLDANGCRQDDIVKVTLVGNVNVETQKDPVYLARQFEEEFTYFAVKDDTKYSIDYNSYIHDMTLKGEFIRTVILRNDLDENEKNRIIRCGICALKGEESDI